MAVAQGFNKTSATDSLVFMYDTRDTVNCYLGKATTNFYTNGDFTGGTGIPQEAGSNPTNTIIYLPDNPGGSDYVLSQTMGSAYTEYQINLTTELQSNTTYVMSGWYAESPDYVGSSRMFHARAFSSTGAHTATGTGIGTVYETVEIGGILWKHCYQTITTPADYSNNFNWYVGYSSDSYTGARYYTNLQMEIGSYPSQFVDGSRSITGSLFNLLNKTGINVGSISYTTTPFYPQIEFDGTDDTINTGIPLTSLSALSDFSIECIAKIDSYPTPAPPNFYNNTTKCGVLVGAAYYSGVALYWYGNSSGTACTIYSYIRGADAYRTAGAYDLTPGQYHHLVLVNDYTNGTLKLYANGVLNGSAAGPTQEYNPSLSPTAGNIGISKAQVDGGGEAVYSYFDGYVPITKIYNSALTAGEVLNNYNNYKTRFNLS